MRGQSRTQILRAVSGIVFGSIAPHGGIVVTELCAPEELELARVTRDAMAELGRLLADSSPDAVVVLTPHNVHIDGHVAVVIAGTLEGSLSEDDRHIAMTCPVDVELSARYLLDLTTAGIPAVGVSYGPNDPEEASMPLDWGALIPLWFMGGRAEPQIPVILVAPPRDLAPGALVQAGVSLAATAREAGARVAVIASADHGHAHDPDGPYGFDPASASYDELVVGLVRDNRLEQLEEIDLELVEAARADSFWQLLVLHGALGDAFEAELLSYEVPTYFGMLCAAFTPRASAGESHRGARTTT
jgi:aromatic ring-opening dioxygenase LigB subunit